jgi:L-alanine-DL-glutamate epimerase-like enolase superfamily enzyme
VLHGTVHFGTPEEMARSARDGAAAGWKLMKMKIGLDPRDDLRRYRAVRAAVPDDVRFQLDGNTGYALGEAIQTIREMERIGGVGIIEQPVKTIAEMAKLARAIESPVQADEAVLTPRDAYEIAVAGAAHVLHLKLHKLGGLLRAREIATVAAAAGLTVSVAPYTDLELAAASHFAAATHNASWGAGFTPMAASILRTPVEPLGQIVPPPPGAGLGVDVDLDSLRELRHRDP